jgi:ABC-type uncharacterized transport system permease subunit
MEIPSDLYTIDTLFSLTGSATAVWIITSVVGYVLEPKDSQKLKKWLGLALSIALALLGATLVATPTALTWVVAVVNGFLIYLTAVGANTVLGRAASAEEAKSPMQPTGASRRRKRGSFTEPWW